MTLDDSQLAGGRFTHLEPLGEGGMGVVYRARDELTGERVALKRMRADAPEIERFKREAKLLSRVQHEAVVRYVAHGSDDAGPWVAMEPIARLSAVGLLDA